VALAVLVQDWDSIALWLAEPLFADDVYRRAFVAVADAKGVVAEALEAADPEAREVLERASVVDLGEVDAAIEAYNLIGAATRRELARRRGEADLERARDDAQAKLRLEELSEPTRAAEAAGWLLGWLPEHS